MNETKRVLLGMLAVLLALGGGAVLAQTGGLWIEDDPVVIASDHLWVGDKQLPSGLPAEDSVWVCDATGAPTWAATSGFGGPWSQTGTLVTLTAAGNDVRLLSGEELELISHLSFWVGGDDPDTDNPRLQLNYNGVNFGPGLGDPLDCLISRNAAGWLQVSPAWQINGSGGVAGFTQYSGGTAPGNAASGAVNVYTLNDGKLYCKDDAGTVYDLTATGSGGYAEVQEEGSAVTARTKLNFVGSSATAADDAGSTRTNVTFATILNTLASLSNSAGYLKNNGSGGLSYDTPAAGAPTGAQYVTLATDAGLSAERVATAGVGVTLTDAGADGALTIAAPLTEGPGLNVVSGGAGAAYTLSSKDPWIIVPKTADQAKTLDNTIANDNTLVFTAAAASTYLLKGTIYVNESALNDFQWSILSTQTPVANYGKYEYIIPSALTTVVSAFGSSLPSAVVMDTTGNGFGWVQFEIQIQTHATNSATIGFAWAQRTSGLGAATVLKGSYIEYQKIS